MLGRRWLSKLSADELGQTTIEYALLLAAVALPVMWVFRKGLAILAEIYKMTAYLLGLPFP